MKAEAVDDFVILECTRAEAEVLAAFLGVNFGVTAREFLRARNQHNMENYGYSSEACNMKTGPLFNEIMHAVEQSRKAKT